MATTASRIVEMNESKLYELQLDAQRSARPGSFAARLTRTYTKEQQAKNMGMSANNLRNVHEKPFVPVYAMHKGVPGGETISARYNPKDGFVYVRGQINCGDRGAGDSLYARHKCGDLRYVSAAFTVPPENHPDPGNFESRLLEVSFVDKPHEPFAEVFVCHSSSEADKKQPIITFCSSDPVQVMSGTQEAQQQSSAPSKVDLSGLSAEARTLIEKLTAENSKLQAQATDSHKKYEDASNELAVFHEDHKAAMLKPLDVISKSLEGTEGLTEEQRNLQHATWSGFAGNRATAHAVTAHAQALQRAAEYQKQLDELTNQNKQVADEMAATMQQYPTMATTPAAAVAPLLGSTNFAPGAHPMGLAQPQLVAQHAAGGTVSATAHERVAAQQKEAAESMAKSIAAQRMAFKNPGAKRQAV